MRKPARPTRSRIRPTKTSYSVIRSAASKCWTTVTSTPAAASRASRSSGSSRSGGAWPRTISSGCASKVITAGRAARGGRLAQPGRAGSGGPGGARRTRRRPRNRRPWARLSPATPWTTSIDRGARPAGRRGDRGREPGVDEDLVGREPPAGAVATATGRPSDRRPVSVRRGRACRPGTDELAAADGGDLGLAQRNPANRSRPASIGRRSGEAGRTVGGRLADRLEGMRRLDREPPEAVRVSAPR